MSTNRRVLSSREGSYGSNAYFRQLEKSMNFTLRCYKRYFPKLEFAEVLRYVIAFFIRHHRDIDLAKSREISCLLQRLRHAHSRLKLMQATLNRTLAPPHDRVVNNPDTDEVQSMRQYNLAISRYISC